LHRRRKITIASALVEVCSGLAMPTSWVIASPTFLCWFGLAIEESWGVSFLKITALSGATP